MRIIDRIREHLAFTKNEQKVFLFLALVFCAGIAIKAFKAYVIADNGGRFDYSASDSVFVSRSRSLEAPADSSVTAHPRARKIDLNAATKRDLVSLPGIGEAMAERIILYRSENGAFRSVTDLKKVKGIGAKKFENLKPYIEVK